MTGCFKGEAEKRLGRPLALQVLNTDFWDLWDGLFQRRGGEAAREASSRRPVLLWPIAQFVDELRGRDRQQDGQADPAGGGGFHVRKGGFNFPQTQQAEHRGNIFEHTRARAGDRVEIQLQRRGEVFERLIRDPGLPWRAPNSTELPSDPMAESGRGLAIINAIVLSTERYRNGRCNVVLYRLSRDL